MPLQETSGAASYDAFGGGAAAVPTYIEDVFSTYLYTGTGATQTITNGIDLSGKGGLVWTKSRSNVYNNALVDTVRGGSSVLVSNNTDAASTSAARLSFGSTGYDVLSTSGTLWNGSGSTYASWTFREQAKFFDVVTYTGNDAAGRQIAHSLGSAPGFLVVKCTSTTGTNWRVWHRSLPTQAGIFNTNAFSTAGAASRFGDGTNVIAPTSTVFTVGNDGDVNSSGLTYVAYLFAHDAGGFGLTGTDNVISCGSYVGNGTALGPVVNLGYEPQWLLVKDATNNGNNWILVDTMRGFIVNPGGDNCKQLEPNSTTAEFPAQRFVPNSTGFQATLADSSVNGNGSTYIYIAIRRGPMKVPTTGTSVLGLNARSGTNANATVTGGAGVTDAALIKNRGSSQSGLFSARLIYTSYLVPSATSAENVATAGVLQANPWDVMDGIKVGTTSNITNASGQTFINYLFRRAPNYFDVVCYTGDSVGGRTVAHNLGVAPQLLIVKRRDANADWAVYSSGLTDASYYLRVNQTSGQVSNNAIWNSTAPTSTVFTVGTDNRTNLAAATYIGYLFATCPNVSKVGSYVGNGSSQTINCGFTGGARFVLIKKINDPGNWYYWDSARGIVAGNDPYLTLNTIDAEVSDDSVDTDNTGFIVNSTGILINTNNDTYIFLAIA